MVRIPAQAKAKAKARRKAIEEFQLWLSLCPDASLQRQVTMFDLLIDSSAPWLQPLPEERPRKPAKSVPS